MGWWHDWIYGKYEIMISNLQAQIEALKKLNKFQNPPLPPQPAVLGQISYQDLLTILRGQVADPTGIYLSDNLFQLTSKEEACQFAAATNVQARRWVAEDHDCDNFSFALMGYWSDELKSFAFGIAWSQGHAFNWMVDKDRQLWICEPQTDSWIRVQDNQNPIYKNWRLALC